MKNFCTFLSLIFTLIVPRSSFAENAISKLFALMLPLSGKSVQFENGAEIYIRVNTEYGVLHLVSDDGKSDTTFVRAATFEDAEMEVSESGEISLEYVEDFSTADNLGFYSHRKYYRTQFTFSASGELLEYRRGRKTADGFIPIAFFPYEDTINCTRKVNYVHPFSNNIEPVKIGSPNRLHDNEIIRFRPYHEFLGKQAFTDPFFLILGENETNSYVVAEVTANRPHTEIVINGKEAREALGGPLTSLKIQILDCDICSPNDLEHSLQISVTSLRLIQEKPESSLAKVRETQNPEDTKISSIDLPLSPNNSFSIWHRHHSWTEWEYVSWENNEEFSSDHNGAVFLLKMANLKTAGQTD